MFVYERNIKGIPYINMNQFKNETLLLWLKDNLCCKIIF